MTTTHIGAMTDAQLDAEIVAVADEVCCATSYAASVAFCGCHGFAGEYLQRLRDEADRREREAERS
jgi:hypothetical protein